MPHSTTPQKDTIWIIQSKKPNLSYFKTFGSKCFIYNNGKKNLSKFDSRSNEGIFVGYSSTSRAYRFYNKCTKVTKETIHVFDETNDGFTSSSSFDEF